MRHRPRTDRNHGDIVKALRQAGCSVLSMASLGNGVVDILIAKNGHLALAEIKDGEASPSKRKLTPDQVKWISQWKSKIFLLQSVEDAIKLSNAMV